MTPTRTTPKGKTLNAPDALVETPLALFAPVTAACAERGVSAIDMDDMEVWQIASTLGIGMSDDDAGPSSDSGSGAPPPGSLSRGRARRQRAGV